MEQGHFIDKIYNPSNAGVDLATECRQESDCLARQICLMGACGVCEGHRCDVLCVADLCPWLVDGVRFSPEELPRCRGCNEVVADRRESADADRRLMLLSFCCFLMCLHAEPLSHTDVGMPQK